jgi:hypothetical protein
MKVRIVDPKAAVFSQPDSTSPLLATFHLGDEVDYSGMRWKGWKSWAEVILPGGKKGYLTAETKVFFIKPAVVLQDEIKIYSEPSVLSLIIGTLQKKTRVEITRVIDKDNHSWVRVRCQDGVEGYIDGRTRIRMIKEVTRAAAKRMMLSGGLWCLAALVVSGFPFSSPTTGGAWIVIWGALIFGICQFLYGFYQYRNSSF